MNKSADKNIYKNAIVTYDNGKKEIYDAISITNKGIYTGVIKINKSNCKQFIDDRMILKENVKSIIILDKNGKSQIIF